MKVGPALAILALLAVTHCSKERQDKGAPSPSPAASAVETTPPPPAESSVRPPEAVRSVYPLDAGPAPPLVHALCSALHDLPEQRRAACCEQGTGVVVTGECERMLTSAIGSKAASLDAAEVDRCAAAMQKAREGCDWIGPLPPDTPAECVGIVHGFLEAGAPCRSSLECARDLRCHGVGPTIAGKCGRARADGEACGSAVDTLAVFVKEQAHLASSHPECAGYCDRLRCAPLAPKGAACRTGAQCADGACAAGKCSTHILGRAGAACPTGECADDARCLAGKCVVLRPAGGLCKSDLECRGACLKPDGGPGLCGKRCDTR